MGKYDDILASGSDAKRREDEAARRIQQLVDDALRPVAALLETEGREIAAALRASGIRSEKLFPHSWSAPKGWKLVVREARNTDDTATRWDLSDDGRWLRLGETAVLASRQERRSSGDWLAPDGSLRPDVVISTTFDRLHLIDGKPVILNGVGEAVPLLDALAAAVRRESGRSS